MNHVPQKRVFIFDDNQDILHICTIILRAKGYEVRTNTTCNDLLQLIRDFKPDVVIMDNKIPEIGGVEATRLIKASAETNRIPVIMFSANAKLAELTRQAGADLYIEKPFDISLFEGVVDEMINRREFLDNEAT